MPTADGRVRIALIHALEESIVPARRALLELWPEAFCFDLLDTSLALDLTAKGALDEAMVARFRFLATYVSDSEGCNGKADGILFTCSAFGAAIDAVKQASSIPVLRPNEAAFDLALDLGTSLALVVSFQPSAIALESELRKMVLARGKEIRVTTVFAAGALDALKQGDGDAHDRIVATAAAGIRRTDAVILGQFSLARARAAVERACGVPTITTPHSAVLSLKRLILG